MEEAHLNKASRILYIYTKLLQGEVLQKRELAQQTGVNEKSIQRDLDDIRGFLDDIKILSEDIKDMHKNENENTNEKNKEDKPLIYDRREKGYCLNKNAQMRLSNNEVLAISKILLESRAFTKEEMNNILDKLIANCIPCDDRAAIKDLLRNERFHYVELRHHKEYLHWMTKLSKAIRESRVI